MISSLCQRLLVLVCLTLGVGCTVTPEFQGGDWDSDGVPVEEDCDDEEGSSTVVADDTDCDGVLTAADCDDQDATMPVHDADCDGVLTADDCNDSDPVLMAVADDGDCDGVLTEADCDDSDPSTVNDMDCDGVLTEADCDDTDATIPGQDADCDGVLTAADCDDSNPGVGDTGTSIADDADCDGILTAADCDDDDLTVATATTEDGDCDGVLTAADCDDSDSTLTAFADDGDCDGILTAADCDDSNPDVGDTGTAIADDADCDGVLTAADCDDTDASLLALANDGDCDGALTGVDCDDTNPAYHPGATEADCTDPADYNCDGSTGFADADGDNWPACQDCDDSDGSVNPMGTEVCDGQDNDCDGWIDEAGATGEIYWYADFDGDGYGRSSWYVLACAAPVGYVALPHDCDDLDVASHPGATEVCDGADNNCDADVDEGVGPATWYADFDGDGFGNPALAIPSCVQPVGTVADGTDCDDLNPFIYPGATELCDGLDNDCDGSLMFGGFEFDDDGDGAPACADCDDNDPLNFPGNPEVCDGQDNDCDLSSNEGNDNDGDGMSACAGDCNDSDPAAYPGAPELCDGQDTDCDPSTEAGGGENDADNDGVVACLDCNDSDPTINPGAIEHCDGQDNDCDNSVDEGVSMVFYADGDGDGYGDPASPQQACLAPIGAVVDSSDCDDLNDAAYPGAIEYCDGLDNDCDNAVDEGGLGVGTWYPDTDGDGYGVLQGSVQACQQPPQTSANPLDCDDTSAGIYPGAPEVCDGVDYNCDGATGALDGDGDGYTACQDCDDDDPGRHTASTEVCDSIDNNCDGQVDEVGAAGEISWYLDVDGDGFGRGSWSVSACAQPVGYVANASDCRDLDPGAHPGAVEFCDGLDNNCDGQVDEGAAAPSTWYPDIDGDGFGDPGNAVTACMAPAGYVADSNDCDDLGPGVHPGATEVCDGIDNNCDSNTDEGCP